MPEYFTLAELRELPLMDDATTYTDLRCEAAAAYVVGVIERVVGTSFIERTATAEIHNGGGNMILPKHTYVRSVTSATDSGVTVTDSLSVDSDVVMRFAAGSYLPKNWTAGVRSVSITYKYGYSSTVPADVKEAALKATKAHLVATNSNAAITERQTSMSTDAGTITFVVAGADRPFGYPEVDAVIIGWRDALNGPSVG